MKKLWLYLHFPHLQLNCQFPDSDDKAMVILDAKTNHIRQLNGNARKCGLKTGMGLGTAAALCHQLEVEPYNADIEHNRLRQLADSLYKLTSDICLFPPNGILLRIHNMLHLYRGLGNYWKALELALKSNRLCYLYATGSTPLAAKLLAQTGWNTISSDHQKMRSQVLQQPLQYTELPPKSIEKLNRVGIKQVADLARQPLSDIAKRFDIQLVTYLGRLLGDLHHSIHFYHPETRFNRQLELLYEVTNSERLSAPIKQLLLALETFLQLREQVTDTLKIALQQREHPVLEVELHSAGGEYRASKWQLLLSLKLEKVKLASPVLAISLTTGETQPRQHHSDDFFEGSKRTIEHQQLLAILETRLGKQSVNYLQIKEDFRPEYINSLQQDVSDIVSSTQLLANRPLFLFTPAQPLTEKVKLISGPERIHTGWWDDNPVIRDYFVACSDSGRWYWIFRTPDQHWYLHGVFS